jgi:hypothetical protein
LPSASRLKRSSAPDTSSATTTHAPGKQRLGRVENE